MVSQQLAPPSPGEGHALWQSLSCWQAMVVHELPPLPDDPEEDPLLELDELLLDEPPLLDDPPFEPPPFEPPFCEELPSPRLSKLVLLGVFDEPPHATITPIPPTQMPVRIDDATFMSSDSLIVAECRLLTPHCGEGAFFRFGALPEPPWARPAEATLPTNMDDDKGQVATRVLVRNCQDDPVVCTWGQAAPD
jgi:hypothetical protein